MELQASTNDRKAPAPIWHLFVLLAFLLIPRSWYPGGTTVSSALRESAREWSYFVDFLFQGLAFGLMCFGLSLYGTKLSEISGDLSIKKRDLGQDTYLGLLFFILSVGVAVLIFILFEHPPYRSSRFLPKTAEELWLFAPLAITAGFCEELIFRGYLLKQFYAMTGRMPLALGLQALLFSVAHGYHQTPAGFGDKVAFGLLMGFLANWRKSLISPIIAHASSDLLAGVLSVLIS